MNDHEHFRLDHLDIRNVLGLDLFGRRGIFAMIDVATSLFLFVLATLMLICIALLMCWIAYKQCQYDA